MTHSLSGASLQNYNNQLVETLQDLKEQREAVVRLQAELESSGQPAVILAVAGLAAALPGVVAVKTELPVVGVPVPGGPLNGVDALLSICQVPGQVPLGTVGLHSKAPLNACMYAHRILKLADRNG